MGGLGAEENFPKLHFSICFLPKEISLHPTKFLSTFLLVINTIYEKVFIPLFPFFFHMVSYFLQCIVKMSKNM